MTFSYSADPIVDELLGKITVPHGWTKSNTDAEPPTYRPNTLYAWVKNQDTKSVQMDGGLHPEMWFHIRLAWSVGTGEANGQVRKRETTEAIDAGITAIIAAVTSNPTGDTWEGIEIDSADPKAVVTFDVRAGWVDVSGYRLV